MQIVNRITAIIIGAVALLSCTQSSDLSDTNTIDLNEIETESISVSKLISDIEIIPLETNEKCLLSDVLSLKSIKDGFITLNYDVNETKVFAFDSHGNFISRIGEMGHSKREYVQICGMNTDREGDTIMILDDFRAILYDRNGEYINSKSDLVKAITTSQATMYSNGYIIATEYAGSPFQVHIYDKNLSLVKELFPTNDFVTLASNVVGNKMKVEDDILYYLDFYDSTFYIVDLSSNDYATKTFSIRGNNMLTLEMSKSFHEEMVYSEVGGFYIEDGNIIAQIRENDWYTIKIDVQNSKVTKIVYDEWLPYIYDYYNDCYYCLFNQCDILEIIENAPNKKPDLYDRLREQYYKQNLSINEKSNDVIVKMKKTNVYD